MPRNQIIKQPAETFIIGVDFSYRLVNGEIVVLSGSSCSETDTTDEASTETIIDTGTLDVYSDGKGLTVRVSGGIDKHRYKISFRGATNLGNIYEHDITVQMVD